MSARAPQDQIAKRGRERILLALGWTSSLVLGAVALTALRALLGAVGRGRPLPT